MSSMCAKSVMISLICNIINGIAIDSSVKAELNNCDVCENLYVLSSIHDIAHLVALAFKDEEMHAKSVYSNFNKHMMKAIYRDTARDIALRETVSVLEQACIMHIPLKGAVIKDYYPESWMRTSCDIDILVKQDDIEKATEALLNAGFSRMKDSSTHDINFYSPNKFHIELHFTLSQDCKILSSDEVLADIWEHINLKKGFSYCYEIEPEMFILYNIAHMARHFLKGGCGVRAFIDIWLITTKMPFNTEKLNILLKKAGLYEFWQASVELSKMWFENKKCDDNTQKFGDFIIKGGVYGSVSNSAEISAVNGVDKLHTFLSILILPRKNLEVLYPKLKEKPYLYAFYQVKRWFRVFNKQKRKKVNVIVGERGKVSSENLQNTKAILQYTGLLK